MIVRISFVLWLGLLAPASAFGQPVGSPDPADGTTDAPLHLVLQWKGQAAGYNVFFGSDPGRLEFRG